MGLFGERYPTLALVARLTPAEKVRVYLEEKRGHVVARALQELQKVVASSWKA